VSTLCVGDSGLLSPTPEIFISIPGSRPGGDRPPALPPTARVEPPGMHSAASSQPHSNNS